MEKLESLRQQLSSIDQDILELIGRRQQMAAEIGGIKSESGLGVRDYGQEKDVISRAVDSARQAGLSPLLAERLMTLLIQESLTVQEKDRVSRSAAGSGRRALVIGGLGQMGRWIVRFLASQGFGVDVADPKASDGKGLLQDWKRYCLDDYDVVSVTATLPATARILDEMADDPPRGLVFDIGSLKSPLRASLRRLAAAGARVTSIHPMFGPETELLSRRHVIFVDVGVPEATAEARRLFASTMAVQVQTDLESHDRLIAYVLGLSHALNLAFATALAESGEAAPRLARLSSTTFDAQLEVAAKVACDNPRMYFEIQSLNDYGTESLSALLYAVERIRSVVRSGDEEAFVALMDKCRRYLEGSAAVRIKESDSPEALQF